MVHHISKYIRDSMVVISAPDSKRKNKADYVCNGVNDHTKFAAAIAEAAGGRLVVKEGTYDLSSAVGYISIPKNTIIDGQGPGSVLEFGSYAHGALMSLGVNAALRNVKVTGDNTLAYDKQYGILTSSGNHIDDVWIDNAANGLWFPPSSTKCFVRNYRATRIKNSNGWGDALHLFGCSRIFVDGFSIYDCDRGVETEAGASRCNVKHGILDTITDTVLDIHTHIGEGTTHHISYRDIQIVNSPPSIAAYGADETNRVEHVSIENINVSSPSGAGSCPIRCDHGIFKDITFDAPYASANTVGFMAVGGSVANHDITLDHIVFHDIGVSKAAILSSNVYDFNIQNCVITPAAVDMCNYGMYLAGYRMNLQGNKIDAAMVASTAIQFYAPTNGVIFVGNYVISGKTVNAASNVTNVRAHDNRCTFGTLFINLMTGQSQKTFMNTYIGISAANATSILSAGDASSSIPITFSITQPDYPRKISYTLSHGEITEATIEIVGVTSTGLVYTHTNTLSGTTWSGETLYPLATITSVKITTRTGSGVGDTLNVGTNDVLGVVMPLTSVYKVTKNGANITIGNTDTVYHTVDCATISNGDDITIWQRTSENGAP